jgi:dTMP kinase
MNRGKYIVIEGPTGSGKTTQVSLLEKRLLQAGLPVKVFKEPDDQADRLSKDISQIVADPDYSINSKSKTLLRNVARSQFLDVIRKSTEQGVYCLVDQSYLTTLIYEYYGKSEITDYKIVNEIINFSTAYTQPDLVVILDAPVSTLIDRQPKKSVESGEMNASLLEKLRAGYLWEANQRSIPIVFSTEDAEKVSLNVWEIVAPVLAIREPKQQEAAQVTSIKEVISSRAAELPTITDKPKQEEVIKGLVSTDHGNVFVINPKLGMLDSLSSVAKFSNSDSDMRSIIKETAGKGDKDTKKIEKLIDKQVSEYFVLENISDLLALRLEQEQNIQFSESLSPRPNLDESVATAKMKYFVPKNLNAKAKKLYVEKMELISSNYLSLLLELNKFIRVKSKSAFKQEEIIDAVSHALPVAFVRGLVGLGSIESIRNLISSLINKYNLSEAKTIGQALSKQLGINLVDLLGKDADVSQLLGSSAKKNGKSKVVIDDSTLGGGYGDMNESLQLINSWPRNEIDMVAVLLYENSSMSFGEIRNNSSWLPMNKKEVLLETQITNLLKEDPRSSRILDKISYDWEIVCDYSLFRKLQKTSSVKNLIVQALTPRYGYDMPAIIEEAGLMNKYESCFDESFALYNALQKDGYKVESQYATLFGHKLRWQTTFSLSDIAELNQNVELKSNPKFKSILVSINEKLDEVHPLMAKSIKSISKV